MTPDVADNEHVIRVRRVPALHIVTNDHVLANPGFVHTAAAMLEALDDRAALHLRTRAMSAAALYDLAERLCAVAARMPIFINDRADIAAAVGSAGVQLGARSLPIPQVRDILGADRIIGYSAHSAEEAVQAEVDGANFLLMGTIYATETHPDQTPAGTQLIEKTVRRCAIPLIAIGGIDAGKVNEVLAAGASGVAVIRAVWNAPDPVHAAREFARLLRTEDLKI